MIYPTIAVAVFRFHSLGAVQAHGSAGELGLKPARSESRQRSASAFSRTSFAAAGLIHSYRFTLADTAVSLALEPAIGYLAMGLVLLLARWLTVLGEEH